jgi:hypothetical protein
MTNAVTGAPTDLSLLVDLPTERLWELVTDVARYRLWSPECVHAEWLGAAHVRPPEVGNRFAAHNRFCCRRRGERTRLQHSFEHGRGQTWVQLNPAELDERIAELRSNVTGGPPRVR